MLPKESNTSNEYFKVLPKTQDVTLLFSWYQKNLMNHFLQKILYQRIPFFLSNPSILMSFLIFPFLVQSCFVCWWLFEVNELSYQDSITKCYSYKNWMVLHCFILPWQWNTYLQFLCCSLFHHDCSIPQRFYFSLIIYFLILDNFI